MIPLWLWLIIKIIVVINIFGFGIFLIYLGYVLTRISEEEERKEEE
jgi:hypothetical protein